MVITKQVPIIVLGIVYSMLLAFLAIPHHHHAEVACYTTTHCNEDGSGDDQHNQETAGHHHEHNAGDEIRNCLSIGYYVSSDAGFNVKRVTDYSILHNLLCHAIMACMSFEDSGDDVPSLRQSIEQPPNNHTYLTQVLSDIPHRGPPQFQA